LKKVGDRKQIKTKCPTVSNESYTKKCGETTKLHLPKLVNLIKQNGMNLIKPPVILEVTAVRSSPIATKYTR